MFILNYKWLLFCLDYAADLRVHKVNLNWYVLHSYFEQLIDIILTCLDCDNLSLSIKTVIVWSWTSAQDIHLVFEYILWLCAISSHLHVVFKLKLSFRRQLLNGFTAVAQSKCYYVVFNQRVKLLFDCEAANFGDYGSGTLLNIDYQFWSSFIIDDWGIGRVYYK